MTEPPRFAWHGPKAAVNRAKHRVTFEPNLSGEPDPSGMQLRIDGNLTTLPANGIDLGANGRVVSWAGGGIEVDFPDETTLIVTPNWWPTESKWYLNVDVYHSAALEGVMGARARGSWLSEIMMAMGREQTQRAIFVPMKWMAAPSSAATPAEKPSAISL